MAVFMPSAIDSELTSSRFWFPLDSLEYCPPIPADTSSSTAMPSGIPYFLSAPLIPQIKVVEPPANRLIDLLNFHYPDFVLTQPLQAHVRQAVRMTIQCHTSALGGHVERCPDGHVERIFYNSCGHRFCPRCAGRKRRSWLIKQRAKLLPVRHYHAVFTLPHAFNQLWRLNPQVMGNLLFHSAVGALRELLADERHLGAQPGITVTLETWDERLKFHPHLHCLVTGGGLNPKGEWKDVPNPRCLVAVKPLMVEFRKRFCQGLKQMLNDETLSLPEETRTRRWLNRLNKVNRQKWEVFIAKPPEDGGPGTDDILRYQAEDVAGGPLSGERLVSVKELSETQLAYLKSAPLSENRLEETTEEGTIVFRWGKYDPVTGKRERTELEALPVEEFLRRYLQHVPPARYQTVRHYGLYTSAKKADYEKAQQFLAGRQPSREPDDIATEPNTEREPGQWSQDHICPICGKPLVVSSLLPSSRTGKLIPRVRLGQVLARPPDLGGTHVS